MGLFSKKIVTCVKCGKECEEMFAKQNYLCHECTMAKIKRETDLIGYIDYTYTMGGKKPTEEQLEQIEQHRIRIMEKYRLPKGITRNELAWAADNHRKLNEQQIADILIRYSLSSMRSAEGIDFTSNFFILTGYQGVVVDVEDIFAIGLISDHRCNKLQRGTDTILCAVFTNDPYIPAFPIRYTFPLRMMQGELAESKEGRAQITAAYNDFCPNLTYPIVSVQELRDLVAKVENVRGKISKQFMGKLLSEASWLSDIFDMRELTGYISPETIAFFEQYGYLREEIAAQAIGMHNNAIRKFWDMHINKINNGTNR